MTARVLVAGVGNVFLGDDAFGVEVANRLDPATLPADVEVAEFGIRGVHLAYQLLDGYESLVLVDAMSQGGSPGDLYVFEPARDQGEGTGLHDAHDLSPATVLALVDDLAQSFGGGVRNVRVIGCEPASVDEGIGLSEAVESVVPDAVTLVHEVVEQLLDETATQEGGGGDGALARGGGAARGSGSGRRTEHA